MVTITAPQPARATTDAAIRPAMRPGSIAYWVSGALALSTAASSLLTIFVPDILRGPAAMNGSARGTALVVLIAGVAVPQLTLLALIVLANRWALLAGYLAGLALVAWIAVQLLVLQRYFFLQLAIACLGGLEFLLARTWQHRSRPPGSCRTAP